MKAVKISYRGKIILTGDPQVGKTSLLSRYCDDKFPDNYNPTVGANFLIKEVDLTDIISQLDLDNELKREVGKKGFKIYFWDIGGQHDKLFQNEYYFQDAVGAIIVFDLINKESFDHLDFWIDKIKSLTGNDVPFIIVGNKTDLSEERKIALNTIEEKAEKHGVEYFETSAKKDENVRKAFESLAIKVLNNLK
ncbi:MAG: GTP-binding protein [Promethearchaeota archaeon]|nr:MAG: GTP-binding protein [Candidatus Lokiarchaeota archaeon]